MMVLYRIGFRSCIGFGCGYLVATHVILATRKEEKIKARNWLEKTLNYTPSFLFHFDMT